jgi:ABC-type nitrate/sulfonate/bicarbonate transport system substrate-binding protein
MSIDLIGIMDKVTRMVTYDSIVFTRCPVPTATGIAADLGWLAEEFARYGIGVSSLQDGTRDVAAEIHYTHAHPGLFREGGNVPALWARSRGEPTRLIGLTWIEERQAILVRPDSEISQPAQLKGARLAIPRHDVSIDFWRAMALHGFAGALSLAGLSLADATPTDIAADRGAGQWGTEIAALARGEVDAVYVKGAVAAETAARLGVRTGIDLDAVPDKRARVNNGTPRPITVHQRLLDERPDLVVRFLEVLLRAADWAAANPADVARILAAETGSGPAGVTAAYQHAGQFRTLHADLSAERLELLAEQEFFLRQHGFLAGPVDVQAWADHIPLETALTGVSA